MAKMKKMARKGGKGADGNRETGGKKKHSYISRWLKDKKNAVKTRMKIAEERVAQKSRN